MPRSSIDQTNERIEEAANLLSEGWPGRRIDKELADKYEVSAQSARSYVRKGRELLVEAVAPQDRAFMFAQVLAGSSRCEGGWQHLCSGRRLKGDGESPQADRTHRSHA